MSAIVQLQPGTIFANDYRVESLLNSGGMGAVYVVEQLSTSKRRALKLMHPQLVADPTLRKRFELEAKVGARIESEHIVEVQAAGVDAATGTPWLVMELLRGEDLAKTVERLGPLPPKAVRNVFEQLCHAVGAAHAAGIVHRDLKPENIFLAQSLRAGSEFTVKVLDFGIAKLAAEAGTKHTAAMGSPIWMSPEQTDRGAITAAADVWALGLIAFHLLTGTFFWRALDLEHPTVTQLMREIVLDPIVPASARAAEKGRAQALPPGFDEWFARCVVREPARRFQDARAAWAELARVLSGAQGARVASQAMPALATAPTAYADIPRASAAPVSAAPALPWEQQARTAAPIGATTSAPLYGTPPMPSPQRSSTSPAMVASIVLSALVVVIGGGAFAFLATRDKPPPIAASSASSASSAPAPSAAPSAPSVPSAAPSTVAASDAIPPAPDVPGAKYYVRFTLKNDSTLAQSVLEKVLVGTLQTDLARAAVQSAKRDLSADAERDLINGRGLAEYLFAIKVAPVEQLAGKMRVTVRVAVFTGADRKPYAELTKSATYDPGTADADLATTLAHGIANDAIKSIFGGSASATKGDPPRAQQPATPQTTPPPKTDPPAPPPPPKRRTCGCAPDDLMCLMACSAKSAP